MSWKIAAGQLPPPHRKQPCPEWCKPAQCASRPSLRCSNGSAIGRTASTTIHSWASSKDKPALTVSVWNTPTPWSITRRSRRRSRRSCPRKPRIESTSTTDADDSNFVRAPIFMRSVFAIFLVAAVVPAPAAERPAFQILRYTEDWSFLRDPARRVDFLDPSKYIPFNTNGGWYLSFGGEA